MCRDASARVTFMNDIPGGGASHSAHRKCDSMNFLPSAVIVRSTHGPPHPHSHLSASLSAHGLQHRAEPARFGAATNDDVAAPHSSHRKHPAW